MKRNVQGLTEVDQPAAFKSLSRIQYISDFYFFFFLDAGVWSSEC